MPLTAAQKKQLKQFGENVRRERVRAALTQERLAELVDLYPRTVQKIEAGSINVLITTAIRLTKALRCTWDRLLP